LRKAPEGWTRTLRHDEGRVSLMCDCRSDWVMCFRRDCERAAALNEATSSRSNEHLNLLMTPVGASKGQQAMAVAMMYPEPAKGAGSLKNSEFQALVFTGLALYHALGKLPEPNVAHRFY
jgi:hypothetical protein